MSNYEALDARYLHLHKNLDAISALATEMGQEATAARIKALRDKSAERCFRVAIVGEFSTGKSALVNALLGEDLLPTALEACTAVVTRIRCAGEDESPGVSVRFRKSGKRTVPREQLRELLTFESREEDDIPMEAEVVVPQGSFLDHGIELIDTPGVNDPDARGEQVTLGFLPQADAIIFITHASRAFKESELEFLRDRIGEPDRDRVLFAINACDILEDAEDFDDLRDRAAQVLAGSYESPQVHLISARAGLAARQGEDSEAWTSCGMLAFAAALDHLLADERGEAELQRFEAHANQFHDQLKRKLEAEIQDLGMDDAIRQRRCERVRERIILLEQAGAEAVSEAKSGFENVRRDASLALESELEPLHAKLNGMGSSGKEDKQRDVAADVERELRTHGNRALTKIQSSMRVSVKNLHGELASTMNRSIGQVEQAFQDDSVALVPISSGTWEGLVTVHTDRYVKERQVEETHKPEQQSTSEGGELMGIGLGAMIGFALLGPFGFFAGGLFGLGAAQNEASSKSVGRKIFKTVEEWFVSQRVDADQAVGGVRARLKEGIDPALDKLDSRTVQDVRTVFDTKINEFRERLADLEEPTREAGEQDAQKLRAERLLERLRESTSPYSK
jgi:hypothetical protein